jgi:hypothetical protein
MTLAASLCKTVADFEEDIGNVVRVGDDAIVPR